MQFVFLKMLGPRATSALFFHAGRESKENYLQLYEKRNENVRKGIKVTSQQILCPEIDLK